MDPRQRLFRSKAIERLLSPERLDEPLRVVGLRSWIALLALGLMLAVVVVWSFVGRIPIAVNGQGVLVRPRNVVDIQSPHGGQIVELLARPGDAVEEGQLLGRLERVALGAALRQECERLAETQRERDVSRALGARRLELELSSAAQQGSHLAQQIEDGRSLAERERRVRLASLEQSRTARQEQLALALATTRSLEEQLERKRQLQRDGVVSQDDLLRAEQAALDGMGRSIELRSAVSDLERMEIDIEESWFARQHAAQGLEDRLAEISARESLVSLEEHEREASFDRQIQDLRRNVAQLEQQLELESRITSPRAGVLLELSVGVGQYLPQGARLGSIDLAGTEEDGGLQAVVFLRVGDGKLVRGDGQRVHVAPDNVERERYGSVVGTVREVSSFPVSPEEVVAIVGREEIAAKLLAQGPVIRVTATLEPDPETPSGYRWSSSSGPPLELTPGTTATARVIVEERAPITFLLPLLREYTGIE